MVRLIARRLALGVMTIVLVSGIIFVGVELLLPAIPVPPIWGGRPRERGWRIAAGTSASNAPP